jgi:phosphatidylglycerophosphate synthase
MNVAAVICEASPVRMWGLTPAERLRRFLERRGVAVVTPDQVRGAAESLVVIRGDHVYDDRVLNDLLAKSKIALRRTEDPRDPVVAAHVPADLAADAVRWVSSGAVDAGPDLAVHSPRTLVTSTRPLLRKIQAPFAIAVTGENRRALEQFLYDCSYKSVTDLVTKWVWPVPARWVVRASVRLGLRPNHVTGLGVVLMIVALWLFTLGAFGPGLMAAWAMTFLDTVDGKLARTTLTSSRFGHYLDKVMDIVHPPFWYLAWAAGLSSYHSPAPGISKESLVWAIFAFYTAGRLVEAACSRVFVSGGIFVWRPLDSYFRLVTARRNTCLLLLTGGAAAGRPDLGIWLVGIWTAVTSMFLVLRLLRAWAVWRRAPQRPLASWLVDADGAARIESLAARLFAQRPRLRAR